MLSPREIEERLRGILADVALVQADTFGLDDELGRSGVDSLSMLRGIARVEAEFHILIEDEEFAQIRTLRELIASVERRVIADAA